MSTETQTDLPEPGNPSTVTRIVRDLVTGKDGETHDLGKYSWIGCFLMMVFVVGWNAYKGVTLDITSIATALGAVTLAHGAALWAKKDTEPQ